MPSETGRRKLRSLSGKQGDKKMFSDFDRALLNDRDFKEDSVRETIIAPILAKLGYQPSGVTRVIRSKALTHPYIYVGTRKHPVTIIPDYTLIHDGKPIGIIDAKSPWEDIAGNEHVQQAYSYAIHPEVRCRHFALCNGKYLSIYSTEEAKPLALIPFEEFDSRWENIEKYLSPKFLLEPELRNFSPDFGNRLMRMGILPGAQITMLGVRFGLFGQLSSGKFTASSNCNFGGNDHCVSFDFDTRILKQILSGLPTPLHEAFSNAISRAPFLASSDLLIEVDLTATLGVETEGQSEVFVPLDVVEVMNSKFDPITPHEDRGDIPPHIFRLKNSFEIKHR